MSKISIQMNDQSIRDRVKENDGYCICSLIKNEDTKCMCKEFRSTEATLEGVTCHCGLYTKYLKEDE